MSRKQLSLTLKPQAFVLAPVPIRILQDIELVADVGKNHLTSLKSKESLNSNKLNHNKQKILRPDSPNSKKVKVNRKKKVKEESTKLHCLARIANGNQCRRFQSPGSDLCSCHHKHCPYGKINGPFEGKFLSVPKKRGPKFKNSKEYTLDDLDQDLYLKTEMIKIDTKHFLIDQFGILFSNDAVCEIVGRRIGDEIHWYC